MSVEQIEDGLKKIDSERFSSKGATRVRKSKEQLISSETLRAYTNASDIIVRFGSYHDDFPSDRGLRTPEVHFYLQDGSDVILQLWGISKASGPKGKDLFQSIRCVESIPTVNTSENPKHTLFELAQSESTWHDGTKVVTLEQMNFINAVIGHIQMGSVEQNRLQNLGGEILSK